MNPAKHCSRRTALRRFVAGAFAAGVPRLGWAAPSPAAIPKLQTAWEVKLCEWSPEHPRHDHQLIFPLVDGRLMLVWSEYYTDNPQLLARKTPSDAGGFDDHMPCRISARFSHDKGRTWDAPFVLQENQWKLNVKHPNLLRLKSGEILLSFTGWDSMSQRNVFVCRSADEGKTWSTRQQISSPGWYCTNNDHIQRLSTGRIVLPSHGVVGGGAFAFNKQLESFMYLSDDEGRTWKRSTDTLNAIGRGCHEPSLVELKDGRLLCYIRTTNQCIYQSTSSDGGDHWTKPEPTDLIAPDSPPLLRRIPKTGDLLLVWNRVASSKGTPRTPLTAAISQDEGKSWGHVQHIEPAADWDSAYASVYFQDDEALIAYYSRSHKWSRDTEVMLKAVPVEKFYL